ncbi:MAG: hypothetical protein AAF361_13335, partial [Bacteroidota bacterium]
KTWMEGQLKELGLQYRFIPAVRTKPGGVGIALSHLKVLKQDHLKPPFAILEDDCKMFFDRWENRLNLPDETDGIYLGQSVFGVGKEDQYGIRWGEQGQAKYEIYDEAYLRIKSMLARHAIIYVSEKFRQSAIRANYRALLHYPFHYPGDMAYAEIQEEHLLLAPNQPWCYQCEIFGGNWLVTKYSLLTSKYLAR